VTIHWVCLTLAGSGASWWTIFATVGQEIDQTSFQIN